MFQGAESVPGSLGGGRRDTRLLLVVPALGQTYGTLPLPAGPCCCAWQAGACPESRGVGGAAPDGLSCLQEAHGFSLLTFWGLGCLGLVGLLPHPKAASEGREPQKAPLPALHPCQFPPGLSHHPLKYPHHPGQVPHPSDAPTPKGTLGPSAYTPSSFKPSGSGF